MLKFKHNFQTLNTAKRNQFKHVTSNVNLKMSIENII